MDEKGIIWIVFGHPPNRKIVEIISILDTELVSSEEGAIKEALSESLTENKDYSNWDLVAILLKGGGAILQVKQDIEKAFRKFGVPESEIKGLTQSLARKVIKALKKSSQKKYLYH